MFEIQWSPKASKNLSRLPKELVERIFEKMDQVKQNPFRFLEHFEKKKVYKLRIGDYRALVDVDFNKEKLYIQVFDKRGRVYKK